MKVVSNETMSIVLDDLDRYTVYRIEVWGETVKGGGSVATTFAGKISHRHANEKMRERTKD